MDIVFCAYVYGPEWQDIAYFKDINTALAHLKRDYQQQDASWMASFRPIVVSYSIGNGECLQEKNIWKIDNKDGEPYSRTADQEWGC